jgi:hypothetical protein
LRTAHGRVMLFGMVTDAERFQLSGEEVLDLLGRR